MIRAIHLSLPWPPSVNSYYMSIRGTAGRMLTKRARDYRKDVVALVRTKHGFPTMPASARLRLEIELRAPDCRQRDLDNHLKGLQDALMHAGVLPDDSQIDELVVRRGKNLKEGAAVVMLTELEETTNG